MRFVPSLLLSSLLFAAGCATNKPAPAWHAEAFSEESPFEYRTPIAAKSLCAVGQRALLSQGYQVESTQSQAVRGRKFFQPAPGYHMELGISLVCLPTPAGSVLYANALQTRYELKTSTTSAGVSVAGMGSISLPWLSDKDSLVKVGEETVADPEFYRRLFALINTMEDRLAE
ncbi:DUF2242 domain-containing protein [Azospira restricta]|uniref:DUF2242 domain-containing protein n=1 Tax=Azospira restricta TaxID=404405 RepID=A0A974SMD8_9RHOO|nr:DUF2242 domain-containing protein [Azospira restricta]QRJ62347.1 DUF2242 domain-containing protein [Azospira restricta]